MSCRYVGQGWWWVRWFLTFSISIVFQSQSWLGAGLNPTVDNVILFACRATIYFLVVYMAGPRRIMTVELEKVNMSPATGNLALCLSWYPAFERSRWVLGPGPMYRFHPALSVVISQPNFISWNRWKGTRHKGFLRVCFDNSFVPPVCAYFRCDSKRKVETGQRKELLLNILFLPVPVS